MRPVLWRCGLKPHRNQKDLDLPCREYAAFVEANEQSHHLFEKYLQENKMKRCPKCFLSVELKSGCHFIRCVRRRYCYLCGRQLGGLCTIVTIKGTVWKECWGGKDKVGFLCGTEVIGVVGLIANDVPRHCGISVGKTFR